ncbi:hypothetical protein [Dapis sp. BLCC M229]|uniref:hypothetical protein n=1 Tax=Dapis sp. BLCC M229 TaxID=3400188 RepID=UPI003CF280F2
MQLSKVVGAILNDLSAAQDLANEYSRQLSYKYKKKQVVGEDDSVLSNFQVPSAVLGEVSLDLKFVIKEIDPDGCALDVNKTQGKCDEIGRTAALFLLLDIADEDRNSQSKKIAKKLLTPEFDKRLQTRISQGLFRLCNSFFMSGNNLTIPDIENTIAENIKDELFKHEDIQNQLQIRNFHDSKEVEEVQKKRQELEELCLNCGHIIAYEEIDIETMIQKVRGSPNTDVIVNAETLKEMPIEAIQSLRISAKYEHYQWRISEASQSFHKT